MTLNLVSNSYLEESTAKIRVKQVPWEVRLLSRCLYPRHLIGLNLDKGYQRAGHITLEELALIKKVDRQPRAKTESLLLSDGQIYASLYLTLLKKLQRIDTLQSILVFIADALTGLSHHTMHAFCLTPPGPFM